MFAMALKLCSSPMMGNLAARSCKAPRAPQRAFVVMAAAKDTAINQTEFVKKLAASADLDEKTAKKAVKGVRIPTDIAVISDFIFLIESFYIRIFIFGYF